MKKAFIFLISILSSISAFGQDIINVKDGRSIEAQIKEIGEEYILYKSWNNLSGPEYRLSLDKINEIILQNGEVISYTKAVTPNGIDLPARLDTRLWRIINDGTGRKISSETLLYILSDNDWASYQSSQRLHKLSSSFSVIGIASLGVGLFFAAASGALTDDNIDENLKNSTIITMSIGSALLTAAIPIHFVGKSKLHSAVDNYNKSATHFTIGQTSNGVGLALVF